jgi:hypothetical protein
VVECLDSGWAKRLTVSLGEPLGSRKLSGCLLDAPNGRVAGRTECSQLIDPSTGRPR